MVIDEPKLKAAGVIIAVDATTGKWRLVLGAKQSRLGHREELPLEVLVEQGQAGAEITELLCELI